MWELVSVSKKSVNVWDSARLNLRQSLAPRKIASTTTKKVSAVPTPLTSRPWLKKGVDILYVVTGVPTPQVVDGSTAAEDNLVNQYLALPEADQATVDRILGAMWQQYSKGKE